VSEFNPESYSPVYFEEDDTLEYAQQTLISSLDLASGQVAESDSKSFDAVDKLKEIVRSAQTIDQLKEVDHVLATSLNS